MVPPVVGDGSNQGSSLSPCCISDALAAMANLGVIARDGAVEVRAAGAGRLPKLDMPTVLMAPNAARERAVRGGDARLYSA